MVKVRVSLQEIYVTPSEVMEMCVCACVCVRALGTILDAERAWYQPG